MEEKRVELHKGHRERMVAKLLANAEILTDCEILEIVLFGSIRRQNTNPLAHTLLLKFGSLENVFSASAEELLSVKGVGKRTAELLLLVGQLLCRTKTSKVSAPKKFSFDSIKNYLFAHYGGKQHEEFLAIFVDKNDTIMKISSVARGTESQVSINLTELSKDIGISQPHALVIAHNHPSGIPYPSAEDDELSMKICFMLDLAGVRLYDHIVVAGGEYYSYRMEGRLERIQNKGSFSKFSDYIRSQEE